jgi:hypothetical protein
MTLPCVFCNQRCNYNTMRSSYYCKDCKVLYDGDKEYLHNMTFDCTIKNVPYELTIDADKDVTILACWSEPDTLTLIMDFHPAMKGITPQNVENKIRTLLTYS